MKLNKKQIEAVKALRCDLDELSNKPRRLFSSFYKFIDAFIANKTSDEKEHYKEIIADFNEWEDMFYQNIRHYQILEDCGRAARDVKKELLSNTPDDWNEDRYWGFEDGVKEATKKMAIKINENLIEELY